MVIGRLGTRCNLLLLSYSLASHFLFPDPLSLAASALLPNGGNSSPFGALRQLLYGILSRGNILFQLLLFAFVAGVVTLLSFLCSWLAQKFQKQLHRATETDAQKLHTLPLLDRTDNLEPQSESQTKEVPEPQQEELEKVSQEIWQEPGTNTNESELHNSCDDCEPIQEQPIRNEAILEQTEQPAQKEAAAQSGWESAAPHSAHRTAEPGGQFRFQLQFLLGKKAEYRLQKLLVIGSSLIAALLALVFLLPHFNSGLNYGPNWGISRDIFVALLFGAGFLWAGNLCALVLRNQYKQGMESRFQGALQQLYQAPGPSNVYSQLNAVHTLYALAFVEAGGFQQQVLSEFQNILKLTRSSWYQSTYSSYPSVLVEEVLRRLLSAADFRQFLPDKANNGQTDKRRPGKMMQLWQKWQFYRLFLRDFQTFRAFREGATVSLLSQISNDGLPKRIPPNRKTTNDRLPSRFVLKNYYLVGVNLSKLRIQEAHFQNCQLSHSNWANSDISDCSLSSCLLDQAILYGSAWRRFLWNTNTARELELEDSFLLQGNIEHCNLQGTQNRRMAQIGKGWSMQHCLLRECQLSHSIFLLDNWQGVTASGCEGYSTLLSLRGQLFHWEEAAESPKGARNAESADKPKLGGHLEIKEAKG